MCLCPFLPSPTSGHLSCYKPLSGLGAWLRFSLNTSFFPTLHLAPLLAAGAAKSLQSCPTLWDPIDGSLPGFLVPGILQARTLEWVAISFSSTWKWKVKIESEVAQSYPTPSDPMDSSLPGSSVHGISRARVLEWVAVAFSSKMS